MEGSRSGAGSLPLTNRSGYRRPKNLWILWFRVRNTALIKRDHSRLDNLLAYLLKHESAIWNIMEDHTGIQGGGEDDWLSRQNSGWETVTYTLFPAQKIYKKCLRNKLLKTHNNDRRKLRYTEKTSCGNKKNIFILFYSRTWIRSSLSERRGIFGSTSVSVEHW